MRPYQTSAMPACVVSKYPKYLLLSFQDFSQTEVIVSNTLDCTPVRFSGYRILLNAWKYLYNENPNDVYCALKGLPNPFKTIADHEKTTRTQLIRSEAGECATLFQQHAAFTETSASGMSSSATVCSATQIETTSAEVPQKMTKPTETKREKKNRKRQEVDEQAAKEKEEQADENARQAALQRAQNNERKRLANEEAKKKRQTKKNKKCEKGNASDDELLNTIINAQTSSSVQTTTQSTQNNNHNAEPAPTPADLKKTLIQVCEPMALIAQEIIKINLQSLQMSLLQQHQEQMETQQVQSIDSKNNFANLVQYYLLMNCLQELSRNFLASERFSICALFTILEFQSCINSISTLLTAMCFSTSSSGVTVLRNNAACSVFLIIHNALQNVLVNPDVKIATHLAELDRFSWNQQNPHHSLCYDVCVLIDALSQYSFSDKHLAFFGTAAKLFPLPDATLARRFGCILLEIFFSATPQTLKSQLQQHTRLADDYCVMQATRITVYATQSVQTLKRLNASKTIDPDYAIFTFWYCQMQDLNKKINQWKQSSGIFSLLEEQNSNRRNLPQNRGASQPRRLHLSEKHIEALLTLTKKPNNAVAEQESLFITLYPAVQTAISHPNMLRQGAVGASPEKENEAIITQHQSSSSSAAASGGLRFFSTRQVSSSSVSPINDGHDGAHSLCSI